MILPKQPVKEHKLVLKPYQPSMVLWGNLNATATFSALGVLNPEDGVKGSFVPRREAMLKNTIMLVQDAEQLVSSVGGSEDHLAEAAYFAVNAITQEAEAVNKLGATSLGSVYFKAQVSSPDDYII